MRGWEWICIGLTPKLIADVKQLFASFTTANFVAKVERLSKHRNLFCKLVFDAN